MTEVQIKHAQFLYYVEGEKGVSKRTGDEVITLAPRIAHRNDIVDIPRDEDIERGELHGAFYTEEDYAQEAAPEEEGAEEAVEPTSEGQTHDELVAWIRDEKPTAPQVVAAADSPEKAQALIDAETEASGGDPRKSVIEPLEKIAAGG